MTRSDEVESTRAVAADYLAGGPRPRRVCRQLAVKYRVVAAATGEELHRRERELERLIVKAACNRAARLAASHSPCGEPTGDDRHTPPGPR